MTDSRKSDAGERGQPLVNLAGKWAVVAADFNHARIYAVDPSAGTTPEKIVAPDPSHVNHNIFHHHGNPTGGFDIDRPETNEYLKALSHALVPAHRILLLGHGGGKANFSHLLESYLEKHHLMWPPGSWRTSVPTSTISQTRSWCGSARPTLASTNPSVGIPGRGRESIAPPDGAVAAFISASLGSRTSVGAALRLLFVSN